MDRTGRYLQEAPVISPFDINESMPAQGCVAYFPMSAAYHAGAVHGSNRANGIALQVLDSSTGRKSLARLNRFVNAERVSVRVAVTSPGRAIRIKSQPVAREGINGRIASRRRRFALFRWIAVPVVFPAATPIRIRSCDSQACATNTTSGWA